MPCEIFANLQFFFRRANGLHTALPGRAASFSLQLYPRSKAVLNSGWGLPCGQRRVRVLKRACRNSDSTLTGFFPVMPLIAFGFDTYERYDKERGIAD